MRTTVDSDITAEDIAEVLIDHDAPLVELARKLADKGLRITHRQWGFHITRLEPLHQTLIDIARQQV